MSKGAGGIGSASIVLIFAVLCMTIFALISLQSALADRALASAQKQLVKEYYAADAKAEYILAEILKADTIPEAINETNITSYSVYDKGATAVEFTCPMSETKEICVEIMLYENSYDILRWEIQYTGTWEIDDSLHVWPGASTN